MSNKEILKIMLEEFREYKNEWRDFREKQDNINELVIRNDEKIKGIWRIPIISGTIIGLISGVSLFISLFN